MENEIWEALKKIRIDKTALCIVLLHICLLARSNLQKLEEARRYFPMFHQWCDKVPTQHAY